MSMLEWAKNEVAIASKRERGDNPECKWYYGCDCYDSAMKVFESLLDNIHSGMSIVITKNILNRLIDGKPLTPIEDTEEVWGEPRIDSRDKSKQYQCKRMSSLFKRVAQDGSVTYSDIDRYYCTNEENPHVSWHNGFVAKIYNEMYPLTLPYMPNINLGDEIAHAYGGGGHPKAAGALLNPDTVEELINNISGSQYKI